MSRIHPTILKALACTVVLFQTGCGENSPASGMLATLAPGMAKSTDPLPFSWPPKRGESYPNVQLMDQHGEPVELSAFKGKVILVELVGMT